MPDTLPAEPIFVWRKSLIRSGLGGIAVCDDRVLIGDRDIANQFDVWRCLDANTGESLWTYRYPAFGSLDYDNAPRATPLVHDEYVYLLGAFGQLTCVRLDDGKKVWQRHLRLQYGAKSELVWGLCSSPLIVDDKLIVNPGAEKASWVALNPKTGKEVWRVGGDRHGFASPLVATLGGVRQLIVYDRTSLMGLDIASGQRLWKVKPPRTGDFNVPTPAVVDGHLLVMTENNGTRLYAFDDSGKAIDKPVAEYQMLASDQSTPVLIDQRAFCLWSDLFCLEVGGGKITERWIGSDDAFPETGTVVAGLNHDEEARLLVIGRGGELLLVDASTDEQMEILSRSNLFDVSPSSAQDLLTQPAVVGDRVYIRTEDEIVCVQLSPASD